MSRTPTPTTVSTAGVVVTPGGVHAVVRTPGGTEVVDIPAAPAGSAVAAATAALTAVLAAVAGLHAVTVDVSHLLQSAVVGATPAPARVGVVRIVPRESLDPALSRSPSPSVEALVAVRATVPGGHDLFGNELRPLDRDRLRDVCCSMQQKGARDIAIVAAGSQADPGHEREVANALAAAVPGVHITAASEYGGQGLAAREATVVLNGAMRPVAEEVADALERVLAETAPGVALRIARGDGGHTSPARLRVGPVVVVGAADALALAGAAARADHPDARVVLTDGGSVTGDVRRGLALVRPARPAGLGTDLVVPSASLTPLTGAVPDRGVDVPVVVDESPRGLLAAHGAAVSRPTSWLDEVAFIESAAELERVRRDAEGRATAFVTANGAVPGSAVVVESSMVAVPYSPSGTVRIRVRVAGDAEPEPALAVSA